MANKAGRKPWARPGVKGKNPFATGKANATPRLGQSGKKGFKKAFALKGKFKGEKPGYGKKGRFFS